MLIVYFSAGDAADGVTLLAIDVERVLDCENYYFSILIVVTI